MKTYLFALIASVATKTKIAAVGDSITEGVCSSDESKHSYPVQL